MVQCVNGIYAITPNQSQDWSWPKIIECSQAVLNGGIRTLQMRQKNLSVSAYQNKAFELAELCQTYDALLILNDPPENIELKNWPGVAGVHVGRQDVTVSKARSLWGHRLIVGASCYDRLDWAVQAVRDGASYVAFGALFPSVTKPDAVQASLSLFSQVAGLKVPKIGIGGVQLQHLPRLAQAGVDAVAVVSGLFGQTPQAKMAEMNAQQWVHAWEMAKKTVLG